MFTFQPGSREPDQCREKCSPGYYSPTGLAPCPLHHFQPLSGERQCFQCQSGEETRTTGAASKDDCRAVNCESRDLCENGGECVPIQHKAKCYCPAGFTGQYCEVDVDECARDLAITAPPVLTSPRATHASVPRASPGSSARTRSATAW